MKSAFVKALSFNQPDQIAKAVKSMVEGNQKAACKRFFIISLFQEVTPTASSITDNFR
jgi:hypothetical protein